MSVNKVILIGNVGQDPKVTYYDSGNCVAQASLATTEKGYTLQNGTQIPDRTECHNLIFRNKLGEIVDKYVHKGDKLYVEGKIRTRSYDDQAGIKRYVTEIFVDNMERIRSLVFVLSLVLLTSSCGENKNKDKDYFNGEIRHVDGSHRIIKNVSSKLVPLNGGNYGLIAVHDSLLICWNPKLHNYYFNLFNLNTGEEIASFCPKGQGPEDLVDANPIFQILKNKENELSAFLFERERLLKWNISQSIQKNTTVWDTIVPFTNKAGIHRTYNFIFSPSEDTLLAYVRPDYINEYRVFTPYYEKRIISADVRVQDFHIYKKETILNKEISPDMFFYTFLC